MSSSHALVPFELMHIDIWGPYHVCTGGKYRYFQIIVDDFSRATWVHLLKLKSESLEILKMFCNFVKNQFEKSVKIVRSDNALKFDDSGCKEFFGKLGIIHQTSCVDRPQQNGRVERKHRNILEMSRALRLQAGLPLKYWGECVLTAIHITNRLPSEVLKNVTPHEKLFKKKSHLTVT